MKLFFPCFLAALALLPARLPAAVAPVPIQGGESGAMTLEIAAGQFLGVVVEQDRVDVVVKLFDPEGRELVTADGPDYWMWEEEIALVAETSGTYRLEVHPYFNWSAPGFYRVQVDGPRAPRVTDRTRIEALGAMRAAHAPTRKGGMKERLEDLERALGIWRSLGDSRREAEVLHQSMQILGSLGHADKAAERFHQAVRLWKELGLIAQHAWTLQESSWERGFFRGEVARRHLEEALTLARQAQSRLLEIRILYSLGLFYKGSSRTAVLYLEQALALTRSSGYRDLEMLSLYQLGYSYDALAEKQRALLCYEKALKLARELQVARLQARVLYSLGDLYLTVGHWEGAAEHLQQALEISEEASDRRKAAAALINFALFYDELDPAHRELYENSLAFVREPGSNLFEVISMNYLAFLDLRAGDPAGALTRSRSALPLTAGESSESLVRQAMGIAYRQIGDLEGSRLELETALLVSSQRQDRFRQAHVIPELARTERMAGNLPRALELLQDGVRILESLRTEFVQEELRTTFLASWKGIYELYIDTLMDLHRTQPNRGYDAEALRMSERIRARSLLDILAESGTDLRDGADPALIAWERRLLMDIEQLEKRHLERSGKKADSPEVRETMAQLAAAFQEHSRVEAALRESNPRYATLSQPQPLNLYEIQRDVLDGRALLLEYALGKERSFLWAVTPSSLWSFELPPQAKIEEAARRWYGALQIHPAEEGSLQAAAEARQAADELSAMLLGPVEGLLSGQPLLVVGDGALQYLPFGALPAPGTRTGRERLPLIIAHEVVSLPSASTLAVLRRELTGRAPAPKALAVIADPVFRPEDLRVNLARRARETATALPVWRGLITDFSAAEVDPSRLPRLRFSKQEAEAIAALVPESQRFKALDFDANRALVTGGELARYQMVHFATHGLIDSRHPALSSLVLSLVNERGESQNGLLRLHDIYNLKLPANLVVLSACQTALGQEVRGEGLIGLTRGFMYAGAARVLASLWSVEDRATSVLMERFYRHMIAGRLSPAAALRKAQAEMSHDPRWQSPYYWAGFSLQGEWR